MLPFIVSGAVWFVLSFCFNYFLGGTKDKDGNKSVKLSLLVSFITAVIVTVVFWLVTQFLF